MISCADWYFIYCTQALG